MLQPGQEIGGYRIDALLGKGAMGEVYLGEQLRLGRPVAIKRIAEQLLGEPGAVQRFEREARCVAALADPHIIAVHDFGCFADAQGQEQVLLIMELVAGGRSLKQLVAPDEPLLWQEASALVQQIARGLAVAHEQGVVHRDVKPDNVLLSVKGLAKLADFGLARGSESTALTAAGNMLGTPSYMSPEACQGQAVGPAGDIYSLGATWYHLLTGQPPFREANLMALVHAHCQRQPAPLIGQVPGLPPALAELVHRCLEKDPARRPGAGELIERIAALVGSQLPGDLRDLCRRGGMATDPSTVGTGVDPSADTLRDQATAATAPMSQAAPAGKAQQDAPRPARRWPLFAALLLLTVGLAIWLLGGETRQQRLQRSIDGLLAAEDQAAALALVDEFLRLHAGDPAGQALLRRVVRAESDWLIGQQRFDDALALLQVRHDSYRWLDVSEDECAVQMARAVRLLARNQRYEAESLAREQLERRPRDAALRRQVISLFAEERGSWGLRQWAAWELLEFEATAHAEPAVLDCLLDTLFERQVDDDTSQAMREKLITHHRAPSLILARTRLEDDDEAQRRHGFALLRQAGALTPREELRFHLGNLSELSSSYRGSLQAAVDYILVAAAAEDWHARVAEAGYVEIGELRCLDAWGEVADLLIDCLGRHLAPELRPWALRQVALRGEEAAQADTVRWNAFRLLELGGGLEGVDLLAFHATTLVTFEPWYESRSFLAACEALGAALEGGRGAEARAALEAGQAYLAEVRVRVVANGSSTEVLDRNAARLGRLLAER